VEKIGTLTSYQTN